MATVEEAIQRLTVEYREKGVAETGEKIRGVARAEGELEAATRKRITTTDAASRSGEQALRAYQMQVQVQQQMIASEREMLMARQAQLSQSNAMAGANDNLSRSLVDIASGILTTVGHFKLLAVAAYAMSPAFRAVVAGGVTTSLGLLGGAAGIVSGALSRMVAVAAPALTFLARLSIPITIAVATFKLLNDTIDRGSDLLSKYGGVAAQRKMFGGADINDALVKLTKFQEADLSAQQLQYATQLGTRLEEAKGTLADFLKVQIDLTDPALKLQNAWVVIVESLAKALTLSGQIPTALTNAAQAVGNSSIWDKVPKFKLPGQLSDEEIARRLNENYGPSEPSAEEAMRAARSRLASGMGGGFNKRFNESISDLANPPKVETPDAAKADAWSRYADQVIKATAAVTANSQTVGLGVQAQAAMKVQLEGETILARDGVAATDERRAALQRLAQAAGEAAQQLEQAKIASQIKFDRNTMGLSDADVRIAQQLKGLYPEVGTALASPEAALIRINDQIKLTQDLSIDAFKSFRDGIKSGMDPLQAFLNSLTKISDKLQDMGTTALIKNLTGGTGLNLGGAANDNVAQAVRDGINAAQRDTIATVRAGSPGYYGGSPSNNPNLTPTSASGPNYALAGVGALGAGVSAYQTGAATLSPGKGALAGALGGAMAGAGIGFMFGGPMGAAIGAGIGVVAGGILGFLGGSDAAKKAQQQQQYDMSQRAQAFSAQASLIGVDTNTRAGALQAADVEASSARLALFAQGSRFGAADYVAQDELIAAKRLEIQKQFNKQSEDLIKQATDALAGTEISAVQQRLNAINDSAKQLTDALTDLGKSTTDVASQVASATAKVRSDFESDIQRQINAATGKGIFNDIGDLVKQVTQMQKDASALGITDQSLIVDFYRASAQKLIDGAQTAGDAFDDSMCAFE